MTALLIKLVFLPGYLVVACGALVLLRGGRLRRTWAVAIAAIGVGCFVARTLAWMGHGASSCDAELFWHIGQALWNGRDPYDPSFRLGDPVLAGRETLIYPPNAVPLFSLLTIIPWKICYWVFSLANLVLALALGPLALRVLDVSGGDGSTRLGEVESLVLGSAVALSPSCALIFDIGQLPLVVSTFLLAALLFKVRGRPVLSGISLAVAAVKPHTVLPFLLLFSRWRDLRAWSALAAATLALCLLVGRPTDWPRQLRSTYVEIQKNSQPGGTNDYSFLNRATIEGMIGLDHALYRLGLRNRELIRALQLLADFAIGAWLFWNVSLRSRYSWGAACSLVSLYGMLFLYHRVYDLVILIIPLVYVASSARSSPRAARFWLSVSGVACAVALYLPGRLYKWVLPLSLEWGGFRGWVCQALVLPATTWSVLIALVALVIAEHARGGCARGAMSQARQPELGEAIGGFLPAGPCHRGLVHPTH